MFRHQISPSPELTNVRRVPENCRFEVDDFELAWTYEKVFLTPFYLRCRG